MNSPHFSPGLIRLSCIAGGFALGLIAGARAQNPPTSGPGPDEAASMMNENFHRLGQAVGGLSADESAKLADLEKKLDADVTADPAKFMSTNFRDSAMNSFREILTPEHLKKFDEVMARSLQLGRQIKSQSNLRQVGILNAKYSQDHQNKLPGDLGTLVAGQASPDIFLAGGSKTSVPADWAAMDAKARADWVNKNTDFVDVAAGKPSDAGVDFVVAYIKPEVSPEANAFLMGDGSVQSRTAEEAKKIIEEIKAGKNPPPSMK